MYGAYVCMDMFALYPAKIHIKAQFHNYNNIYNALVWHCNYYGSGGTTTKATQARQAMA